MCSSDLGRESHRGLVHQEQAGAGHEGASDGQHLLLATRERAAELVLALLLQAQVGGLHPVWVLPLMLLHAMLFAGALGVGLERFAYRPLYLRGATRLGPLISAIGASIFLQNAVMLTQGARMKVYMTSLLFPRSWRIQIAGASISALVIVMVVVAGLMMWGLHLLVQRTTLGRDRKSTRLNSSH